MTKNADPAYKEYIRHADFIAGETTASPQGSVSSGWYRDLQARTLRLEVFLKV